MTFLDKITTAQRLSNSLLCVGLDTDPAKIPQRLRAAVDPLFEFNKLIIDATKDLVCAYKLNTAFYEAAGEAGWAAMKKTIAYIPKDIITIGDGKRGDIGNTSASYAKVFFHDCGFDAMTVNPYMGRDSVEPFLQLPDHGVFLLAVTSNSGAKDFQYLKVGKKYLYEKVVEKALRWNVNENIGFVIGATKPKQLLSIRKKAPGVPLLIPGIGAQGGDLRATIRYGCDKNGAMAVINASRSIIYASGGTDFAEAARSEALKLRDEMNRYREEFFHIH
jgi:orotidine-5'-phosphate decarboxylase